MYRFSLVARAARHRTAAIQARIARSSAPLAPSAVSARGLSSSRAVGSPEGSADAAASPAAASPAAYAEKHTRIKGEPILERDAAKAPSLQTLAARLELTDVPYNTLARTLISDTSSLKYANNAGLAQFGRTLLSFYVYEYFMVKYPRLPPRVLKHVVDVYSSVRSLSQVAQLWGVQPETRSQFERYLANVSDESVLGRLSFTDAKKVVEKGVVEVAANSKHAVDLDVAMGTFVRALIAGVYAHRGLDGARDFIYNYLITPRKIDLLSLMAFSRPTRELAVLCAREGLEQPVSRLMAESGRFSQAPVFVVGVFSGDKKLGEGQGSSLKEARTRAAVNALQGWYLYSPVGAQVPSTSREYSAQQYVDPGEVVI